MKVKQKTDGTVVIKLTPEEALSLHTVINVSNHIKHSKYTGKAREAGEDVASELHGHLCDLGFRGITA